VTTETVTDLSQIQLLNPDGFVHGQPHDQWRLLRAKAPVFWHERWNEYPPHWSITRYHDIVRISRDPLTFISGLGIHAGADPDNPDPMSGNGTMMITTDPPRHVRLRRLVNKGFTPRAISALESQKAIDGLFRTDWPGMSQRD